MAEKLKPPAAANRLHKILDTVCNIHGMDKFPIKIDDVIYEASNIFGWKDPIKKIVPVDMDGFDGALLKNKSKTSWSILFNENVRSTGRINYTKAHELGHYILHKDLNDKFECGKSELHDFTTTQDNINIENEANTFASYLLMPFDDFRLQIDPKDSTVNFDFFSQCANRYGVSLTATILRWLDYTEINALLILSVDGFMKWAWSSKCNGTHQVPTSLDG